MPLKRMGLQTIDLPLRPAVCASAAFVGKKEGEGPLGAQFDHVAQDELYGQETFELAEKRLYLDAIRKAILKGGLKPENVQFLLGGDLLNQIITASFSARELGIPFIGLYGAPPWPKACAWAGCSWTASTPLPWSARPAAISALPSASTAILWSSAPSARRRRNGP